MASSALPGGRGECAGLAFIFFLLESSKEGGVEVAAAAMEQPGASLGRELELGMAPRRDAGAAELLALVPLAAATPPDPLVLRLQNLI